MTKEKIKMKCTNIKENAFFDEFEKLKTPYKNCLKFFSDDED